MTTGARLAYKPRLTIAINALNSYHRPSHRLLLRSLKLDEFGTSISRPTYFGKRSGFGMGRTTESNTLSK